MPRELPYEPSLLSASAADSLAVGSAESRSGLMYDDKTRSSGTSPTYYGGVVQQQARLYALVGSYICEHWAVEHVGGLNVGIGFGVARKIDGSIVQFAGAASVGVPANQTARCLWYDLVSDEIDQGAAWPVDATTFVPLAWIDTSGSAVTEIRVALGLLQLAVHETASSISGTDGTAFTLDADNSGAGGDCQYRVNRGATNAEDAALAWDETNDRWVARSQHLTLTRAPLDCGELLIGGVGVVDAGAKLLPAAFAAAALYTVGANGSTPAGLRLTPMGGSGAPAGGAHVAGELALDADMVPWLCVAGGTPGTWRRWARSDAMTLARVDLGADQTGGSGTKTVAVQVRDRDGAALAGVWYFHIGVYADVDGAAEASSDTLSATPSVGARVRWVVADKVAIVKTDAGGALAVDVTMPSSGTCYVLVAPCPRSGLLDCTDTLSLTRA